MTAKLRVYEQEHNTVVIGTDDMQAACRALGIGPTTHRWGSTDAGMYARRRGGWRAVSSYLPPKDARPGVCFHGHIRPTHPEDT